MKAGLKQFLAAVICMVSFITFKEKLPFFWVSSDEYCSKSLLYKVFYYMISAGLVIRAKYYTGFKLAESSVIFCGLSYDYVNKKVSNSNESNNKENEALSDDAENHNFTKIENVKITYFELEIDPNEKINFWNRSVHLWLKYQVYFRLINLPHKFFYKKFENASLCVFVISALWHGFYPGYYIFFIQMYFFQQAAKMLEKKINFFQKVKSFNILVRLILNYICIFTIGSLGYAFCVLDLSNSIKFYKTLYFIPNIFLVFIYIYSLIFLKSEKKNNLKDKENNENNENKEIKEKEN